MKKKLDLKAIWKKHKKVLRAAGITFAAFCAMVAVYLKAKKSGQSVLNTIFGWEDVEGSGPIWDKLKEVFADIPVVAGDMWTIQSDYETGERLITYMKPDLKKCEYLKLDP